MHSSLSAEATLFVSAKGGRGVKLIIRVGPHHACPHLGGQIKDLGSKHYDPIAIGGTTTIVLDKKTKRVKKEFLSLSGTRNNCAGGITPWNTWLSCEEDIDKKNSWRKSHGYVFEVDPAKPDLSTPVPLKA